MAIISITLCFCVLDDEMSKSLAIGPRFRGKLTSDIFMVSTVSTHTTFGVAQKFGGAPQNLGPEASASLASIIIR